MAPDVLLSFWMLHRHSSHHRPILRQPLSAKTCKRLYQAIDSKPESSILIYFRDFSNLSICKAAKTDMHHLYLSAWDCFFSKGVAMNKVHFGSPRSTSPAKEYATPVAESCRIHSLKCDMCVYLKVKIWLPDFCIFSHLWLSQRMSCQITIYSWHSGRNLQVSASYSRILKD